ncbi:MAG: PDZ domain-containing protein, partial [Gemmataceae bacterium]
LIPLLLLPAALLAADAPKPAAFEVPYKTTVPKHIVVRVKINKKGPFNFILDTGAPAMIIATKVGDKAGLENGDDGWATMKRLEIEGGPVLTDLKARVETPFQLEGMNGMGMAGMEIHGMMGYHVLARYRMEIDFTRDKMTWTEVDHDIPAPGRIRKGGGGAGGGLEIMGTMMKGLGGFLGRKPSPDLTLRGFVGMTLEDGDEFPTVAGVLENGPAGKAGVRKGDQIVKVNDRTVVSVGDVLRLAGRRPGGDEMTIRVKRKDGEKDITFKTGEGI